jgi:hypothetical protein
VTLETTYTEHIDHLQRATEAALAAQQYEALVVCSGAPQTKNRFDDQSCRRRRRLRTGVRWSSPTRS